MTRCLVLQHVEPEGPYAIGSALEAAGVEVATCAVHAGDPVPARVGDLDGLVVMGGPMSARTDEGFATRADEVALVAEAIDLRVPTLGVCLGAQVLAAAAGARVLPGPDGVEVGWGPVQLTPTARRDFLFSGLPPELTVLHWHGDTFDLPGGAELLASSARYPHQAFRVGTRAWGLQFHVEVDEVAIEAFLDAFGDDARAAGTTPEEIRAATAGALRQLGPHRTLMADRFAGLVAQGRGARLDQLADRR